MKPNFKELCGMTNQFVPVGNLEAMKVSNYAAEKVVSKLGTSTINFQEFSGFK